MEDLNNPAASSNAPTVPDNLNFFNRANWGAIWAGMFAFFAIWAVFGTLGLGVFASSANASQPVLGMNVGIGAWFVVLTTCAFFIAGRITGRLARTQTSRDGAMYGLIMFGVAVSASLVLVAIGGTALGILQIQGTAHSSWELGNFSYLGWTMFVGCFFGWLAAMAGASSAHKTLPRPGPAVQPQVRHA